MYFSKNISGVYFSIYFLVKNSVLAIFKSMSVENCPFLAPF
jgi:hypothetical protein